MLRYEIHKLVCSTWNGIRSCHSSRRTLIFIPIHRKGGRTDCNNY
jgi:hypothetical protein